MKRKGYIEIKDAHIDDSYSCNCCGKTNFKDGMHISIIGAYNRLNQGVCIALCDYCRKDLFDSLTSVNARVIRAERLVNNEL